MTVVLRARQSEFEQGELRAQIIQAASGPRVTEPLLTADEVADLLGMSRDWVVRGGPGRTCSPVQLGRVLGLRASGV